MATRNWRACLPGLLIVLLGTQAAGFLSDHSGAPLTLIAMLVGLPLSFCATDARLVPGLDLASRSLLRWGIVLVGSKITFGQVAMLGPVALLGIIVVIVVTIATGVVLARCPG